MGEAGDMSVSLPPCPNCGTEALVQETHMSSPGGNAVVFRCPRCQHTWMIYPSTAEFYAYRQLGRNQGA